MGAVPVSAMASAKVELWGDRSSALAIQNESKKIKKGLRKPVIIYLVSPKIIHVEASEFMSLVQQLTGLASSPSGTADRSIGGVDAMCPVEVQARVSQWQGAVGDKFSRSTVSAPVSGRDTRSQTCDGVEEGGLMDSENWFMWQ